MRTLKSSGAVTEEGACCLCQTGGRRQVSARPGGREDGGRDGALTVAVVDRRSSSLKGEVKSTGMVVVVEVEALRGCEVQCLAT
jgi:hypothetical protein